MATDIKELSRRIFEEVWNNQNLSAADEIIASNFVDHDPQSSVQGIEGYKQFVRYYLTAFPDSHFTVEDEISEGTNGRDAMDGQRHAYRKPGSHSSDRTEGLRHWHQLRPSGKRKSCGSLEQLGHTRDDAAVRDLIRNSPTSGLESRCP